MQFTNTSDIIDSRDVIAAIDELNDKYNEDGADKVAVSVVLQPLLDLADVCECNSPDWHNGVALVHESYFTEYTKQLANDGMELKTDWPYNCIDWDAAAEQLKQDYYYVEFDGETYYIQ